MWQWLLMAASGVAFACDQAPGDKTLGELPVTALSFNIRYGTAADGPNGWPHRRELVFDVIRRADADFVGLQEALRFQINAVQKAVPGYAEHGKGRKDGGTEGEYSAILYRRSRWKLDRGETLWLSDTPRQPGSKSWGNTIPRIVTWGRFVERDSGRAVFVFNTHFDHRSQESRRRSAEFIAELIADRAGREPVILMGDLNADEQNPAVTRLLAGETTAADSLRLIDTFH